VAAKKAIFPAALVVAGRRCLVVGGGTVAARKISALLAAGAAVTVVAPEVHVATGILAREGAIEGNEGPPIDVQIRPYRSGEAARYQLVIAATGRPDVDGQVFADADGAGVWVNCADDPDHCSFLFPAVYRDGQVTVAVSTAGASPALAAWLRDELSGDVDGAGEIARLVDEGRNFVHLLGGSTEALDWTALLDGPFPDLVRRGSLEEARDVLRQAIEAAMRTGESV